MNVLFVISIILCCMVVVRLLLPLIILYLANRAIKKIKGFHGKIESIRMNLVGRTISIQRLHLSKRDILTGKHTMIIDCAEIEANFQWRALLRKEIHGEIILRNPVVVYGQALKEDKTTNESTIESTETDPPTSVLAAALLKMPAFYVDLVIDNGSICYNNTNDLRINFNELNVSVDHFSNKLSQLSIPTEVNLNACVYEGRLTSVMELRPLEEHLTFNLHAELHDANVMLLNDLLRVHAKIDVSSGTFGIETEIVANYGGFTGYVKPTLTNIQIIGKEDKNDSFFSRIWEHSVAIVIQLMESKEAEKIAIKIPIEGRLDGSGVSMLTVIGDSIGNAFLQSLWHSMRKSISLWSVVNYTLSGVASFIKKALGLIK